MADTTVVITITHSRLTSVSEWMVQRKRQKTMPIRLDSIECEHTMSAMQDSDGKQLCKLNCWMKIKPFLYLILLFTIDKRKWIGKLGVRRHKEIYTRCVTHKLEWGFTMSTQPLQNQQKYEVKNDNDISWIFQCVVGAKIHGANDGRSKWAAGRSARQRGNGWLWCACVSIDTGDVWWIVDLIVWLCTGWQLDGRGEFGVVLCSHTPDGHGMTDGCVYIAERAIEMEMRFWNDVGKAGCDQGLCVIEWFLRVIKRLFCFRNEGEIGTKWAK